MSDPTTGLPARPSLEQLRKQAKELLQRARTGDASAASRVGAVIPRFREPAEVTTIVLADAQFVIAREAGFENWAALVRHVESVSDGSKSSRFDKPLIRPVEMRGTRPVRLADGSTTTTDAIYTMFAATREGDVARVKALADQTPGLALHEYNYTPPIHFAVREGHLELVKFFLERGADPAYRTYPFQESLLLMAEDREHEEVAAVLRSQLTRRFSLLDGTATILEAARQGDLARVRAEIARDARLARASNETGDTALHQAALHGHRHIVTALLEAGADVD